MAEMMRGMGGLSKMGSVTEKKAKPEKATDERKGKDAPKEEKGKTDGESNDSTTIKHNADGTHEMDGETHPDHLHMLAALGHKVTGGDKHHVAHHDGMSTRTHGIHESGEHQETQEHGSADEAGEGLKQFMGDGEQGGEMNGANPPMQQEPPTGGMMG
jgi:hypothetical protein